MKRQRIGRNERCPCGSGRKYKRCCYGVSMDVEPVDQRISQDYDGIEYRDPVLGDSMDIESVDHQITQDYDEIDYGEPVLDDVFFDSNVLTEFSSHRLLYSILLVPDIDDFARKITTQFITRGKEEERAIEETEDVNELVRIMRNTPDPLNHVGLISKLLRFKEAAVPIIIEELKRPQNDAFVELAVRVIHGSGKDYSNDVLEIITKYHKNAYGLSQLCMLLGFYKNIRSEKVLWDYFHFFKDHFEAEEYWGGPLLGLIELHHRRSDAPRGMD